MRTRSAAGRRLDLSPAGQVRRVPAAAAPGRSSSCSRSTGWSSPRSRRRTRSTRARSTSRSSTSSRPSTRGTTSWSSSATTRCGRTSTRSSSGCRSAVIALVLGSLAAYALVRFTYRPRSGSSASVIGCIAVRVHRRRARRAARRSRSPSALGVFVILAQTIGRRFTPRAGQQRHRVLADLAADPAADRGRDPAVRPVPADRPARQPRRAGHHLRRDQPADRRLADARLLRVAAARARGVGRGRRRVGLPDRPLDRAADLGAGPRGDVPDRADLRLERVPHRAGPDERERPDDAAPGRRPERDPRPAVVGDVRPDPDHDRAGGGDGDRARALHHPRASSSAR